MATSARFIGVQIDWTCNSTTIVNSVISGKHDTYGALLIYNNGYNTMVANSTINGNGGQYAVVFGVGNNGYTSLINNTIANATTLIYNVAGSNLLVDCHSNRLFL